ncbi:Bicarbonate transport system permease protein CmpB [Kordia antarctica]|uniref:Bicarbonate transport system permease protein CmpB n=1 Tax=Kordia antarctica TaxID=1218801 RepID=A0A7L4ZH69_9FLAO|nr:ABC transporter permease [Kordia antarctica]QHI35779.1 Bicarbonate transport system permease protein CmpB [Kordia antarctica]
MKTKKHIYSFIGIFSFISFWSLLKVVIFPNAIFLSSPIDTFQRLWELILSEGLLNDFLATLYKFSMGFGFAVVVGIPIGLFLGINKRVYQSVELLLDFFRSIPVTTLFPLFILFFGISSLTIISMVSVSCLFVIILNTSYGVFYTKESHISYLKSIGANKFQIFKHVVLPSSLPFIFIGLRVSVSFALIVVIVAEMFIGANKGLGIRVYEAHETYLISDVYAIIIFVGLLGYFLNRIFIVLEKKIIHWE